MNSFFSLKKLNCSSKTLEHLSTTRKFSIEVETNLLISKQEFKGLSDVKINGFLTLVDENSGWLIIFDFYLQQESVWQFLNQLERNSSVSRYILETIPEN